MITIENCLKFIGQENIFIKEINDGITNIGFHVHPLYRSKGVATSLVEAAIQKATVLGYKKFHIITETSNLKAIRLARKLHFMVETSFEVPRHTVLIKNIS